MYRCCINTHAELISIRLPRFANLSLPTILSLLKQAIQDDVSRQPYQNQTLE
jgi:hypothetical protein